MDINNKLSAISSSSLTPAQQKAISNYLPENFLPVVRNVTTVRQALSTGTSSLAKIDKNIGSVKTEALVKVYLVRLNELLDLKKNLSEAAIDEIAATVVKEYYMLTMVDVVFVLQQAIQGKYGEMFDSLNTAKVLRWFKDYFNDRCNQAEEMSNEARHAHNSLFGRERSSEQGAEQRAFSKQYAMSKLVEKHSGPQVEPPQE